MGLSNDHVRPYAKACLEISQELGIEVFDIWSEMQKVKVSKLMGGVVV
jgi:hypothetical protein